MKLSDFKQETTDFIISSRAKLFCGAKKSFRGWVSSIRSSGKITFITLRDSGGYIQLVAEAATMGEKLYAIARSLNRETVIIATGEVKEGYRSEDFEILLSDIRIVSESKDFPIGDKEHGSEFLFDNRHLYLRDEKVRAIMKIRSAIFQYSREFLFQEGFYEFSSPIITPTSCEGTTTLFELDYFGESAYLSQSGQLYSEAGIFSLEKIFCFGPLFRAEKSKTRRHLTEFWAVEPEMAWFDSIDNMRMQEKFVKYLLQNILKSCKKELLLLDSDIAAIEKFAKEEFEVVTYTDAVDILNRKGFSMKWGDDFGVKEEEYISSYIGKPVFIYLYPVECRAFYIEPDPKDMRTALSNDLLLPGFGEIITGGQRASDLEFLKSRIYQHGLSEDVFNWYLDLRRYGSVIHSGFGMGVERFMRWICGINHIRETIPFPRTTSRIKP